MLTHDYVYFCRATQHIDALSGQVGTDNPVEILPLPLPCTATSFTSANRRNFTSGWDQ